MFETTEAPEVSSDQALRIAEGDAVTVYRDLTAYRIRLSLESDGWHIDYELKAPRVKGGGPHYIIDQTTGTITSKRYEQ